LWEHCWCKHDDNGRHNHHHHHPSVMMMDDDGDVIDNHALTTKLGWSTFSAVDLMHY
jgi:hypothetical protein